MSRSLPAARAGEVSAIHQARVATRRLREALPLVARGAPGRKLARAVRRLTRALGPVRELDVALLTLGELARARAVPMWLFRQYNPQLGDGSQVRAGQVIVFPVVEKVTN